MLQPQASVRPRSGRHLFRYHRFSVITLIIFSVLALAVTGAGAAAPAPVTSAQARLAPCTLGLCGHIQVPLDWARASGPKLSLSVAVVPARTTHAADPVFLLEGWGGAAVEDMSWAVNDTFKELNQTHDLVMVDQRGIGGSSPQYCTGLTSSDRETVLAAATRKCLAGLARDPRYDTTVAAVEDLNYVWKALGYEKIDLYGGSYGVTVGLAYVQRYPSTVRSAVFESGSLLNVPLWQDSPVHYQHAFAALVSRCSATPECSRRWSPGTDLATVLKKLQAGPVHFDAEIGGRCRSVTVDEAAFIGAVRDFLGYTSTAVQLPAFLRLAAQGDWPAVAQDWADATGGSPGTGAALLQMLTIRCGDAWAAENPTILAAETDDPFALPVLRESLWEQALCAVWPHNHGVSGVVTTSAPVVFLNGTVDPDDPPANVAAAKATMPNSLVVPIPGDAHGVLNPLNWQVPAVPRCLVSNLTNFVNSGAPPDAAAWTACAASLPRYLPRFPGQQ